MPKFIFRLGYKKPEMGCINRDKNSVLSMETIIKELLLTGNRTDIYKRKINQHSQHPKHISKQMNI